VSFDTSIFAVTSLLLVAHCRQFSTAYMLQKVTS